MNDVIDNLANYLFVLGLIALAVEVLVLGFSTFILTFLGLGLLLTGGLIALESIPATLISATGSVAVCTAILAVLLWKPLKKLGRSREAKQVKSDLVGHQFVLDSSVSPTAPGCLKYSGVNWRIESDVPLAAGEQVETVEVNVGVMKIRRIVD